MFENNNNERQSPTVMVLISKVLVLGDLKAIFFSLLLNLFFFHEYCVGDPIKINERSTYRSLVGVYR